MKKLFYSVAHSLSLKQKRNLMPDRELSAYDRYISYFCKSHSYGVYETVQGEILPATYINEDLPENLWLQYPDYIGLNAVLSDEKTSCLVTRSGFFTERGRKIAEQLGIDNAADFKKMAQDNMHFKKQLRIIYVTTSDQDPEKRELLPCIP